MKTLKVLSTLFSVLSAIGCFALCVGIAPSVALAGPPIISAIPDVQIPVNSGWGFSLVGFTVTGDSTATDGLWITVSSSNQSLVPNSNITLDARAIPGGFSVMMKLEPFDRLPSVFQIQLFDQVGETTITVFAGNSAGFPARRDFQFKVVGDPPPVGPRQPPSFKGIPTSLVTFVNQPIGPVEFMVTDLQSSADSLDLKARSSDQQIIPDGSITLDRNADKWILKIVPEKNQVGTATITFTVTDPDGNSTEVSVPVTVRPPPEAPTISHIPDQRTLRNRPSDPIQIAISDRDTPPHLLTLTATVSDYALLQGNPFRWGGSGTNRTLVITPTPNRVGQATITVTLNDSDGLGATDTFLFSVLGLSPMISDVPDQTTLRDKPIEAIPFQVNDPETPAERLTITVRSSNPLLIDEKNILLSGTGADRKVSIAPALGQTGVATVTLAVTDADGQSASDSFVVTVPSPAPPLISPVPNQRTLPNQPTRVIPITVEEVNAEEDDLSITARSSNQTLVPDLNILFAGGQKERKLIIIPTADQIGATEITIIATAPDGRTATESFYLTVGSSDDPPTISFIQNQSTARNQPSRQIPFRIGSVLTPVESLSVTATSSNESVVPDENIRLAGEGADRTIMVIPANKQTGTTTIAVTVTNLFGQSATRSFDLAIYWGSGPLKDDLDRDGHPDLLFQDASGSMNVWFMDEVHARSSQSIALDRKEDPNWRIIGTGDFDEDGTVDLACQYSDGLIEIWSLDGTRRTAQTALGAQLNEPGWRGAATGDFNNDGRMDLLLQHDDGRLALWTLNGTQVVAQSLLSPSNPGDRAWRVIGTADFDQNDMTDLLFQHTDGTLAIWYMEGTRLTQAVVLDPPRPSDPRWRVRTVVDLNQDGRPDLVFQHAGDGSLAAWMMDRERLVRAGLLDPAHPGGTWQIAGQ